MKKTFFAFNCTGREKSLSECRHILTDKNHTCVKPTSVAGVVCSECKLGPLIKISILHRPLSKKKKKNSHRFLKCILCHVCCKTVLINPSITTKAQGKQEICECKACSLRKRSDEECKREAWGSKATENACVLDKDQGSEVTENASVKPEGAKWLRMQAQSQWEWSKWVIQLG